MSSPNETTSPAVAHPTWCRAEYCDATAGHADVRHSDRPVSWQAEQDDVEITTVVQRDDEIHQGRQVVRGYGLALRLHHLGHTNPDGSPAVVQVWLSARDLDRIEEQAVRYFELVGRGTVTSS